jgi:hypothetical protein
MLTITAIDADGRMYSKAVSEKDIAKEYRVMQNKGYLQIKVTKH